MQAADVTVASFPGPVRIDPYGPGSEANATDTCNDGAGAKTFSLVSILCYFRPQSYRKAIALSPQMVSAQLNLGAVLHMMVSVNLLVINVAICYMFRHCTWYLICWCLVIGFVPS